MAATNFTPISLYYSTTASAVPTAANLVPGELAINTNDGKLYYEDSSGVVQVLATKSTGSIGGSNTQVQFNNSGSLGGSSGLTWDGSFLTTSSIKNSALTSGRVTYAGASGLLTDNSAFVFNGNLGLGASTTSGGRLVITQDNAVQPAIYLPTDESTIQGPSANTKILMGGNLTVQSANVTTISAKNASGYIVFATGSTPTEGLRLTTSSLYTASGVNVGIGTSSPSQPLTVNGVIASIGPATALSASSIFMDYNTTSNSGRFAAVGNTTGTAAPIYFSQYSSNASVGRDAVIIDSSGNLLLGTTSGVTNGGFSFEPNYNGGGVSAAFFGHSSSGGTGNQYCVFAYNGTFIGSITQSGTTAVLFNVTSDQRLKTNVVDAPSGNIDSIKVRSFDWIADGSHQEYGMVAQELIEVAPYAVNKPENPDEMMGVDYSKLVPMMIKEIQDLKQRIATLENK
jgi:hypothetical protein